MALVQRPDLWHRSRTLSCCVLRHALCHGLPGIIHPILPSTDTGSFHAASYGMLSGMVFLELYIQFFQVQIPVTIEHLFYCDNQGFLNWMSSSQDHAWRNPNHCLASEYDVKSGIIDTIAQLLFRFAFHHIKGHQDDDTPVIDLPWEAQMNCHADALTTPTLTTGVSLPSLSHLFRPQRLPFVSLVCHHHSQHHLQASPGCKQAYS
jgi:hypothetical protein